MMEYINLLNTDLTVSRLCMGGCQMGCYGWGDVRESELLRSVSEALDRGINFFDTADTYGLGKSEELLAKGLGTRRKDAVIQTKFGVRVSGGKTVYDNSPEYIKTALEASLRRLNTDYIDIYTVHYRDGKTPADEVVGVLEELKKEGKIRYFGLSNISGGGADEFVPYAGRFACCQDEFSLSCRKNENDLRALQKKLRVTPMTWGSLGQGILTGKYDEKTVFGPDDRRSRNVYVNFHGEKLEKNLRIVKVLQNIAGCRGTFVSACAIRWILDKLPGSAVIAGVKKPSQLDADLLAMGWHLNEDEMAALDGVSL